MKRLYQNKNNIIFNNIILTAIRYNILQQFSGRLFSYTSHIFWSIFSNEYVYHYCLMSDLNSIPCGCKAQAPTSDLQAS